MYWNINISLNHASLIQLSIFDNYALYIQVDFVLTNYFISKCIGTSFIVFRTWKKMYLVFICFNITPFTIFLPALSFCSLLSPCRKWPLYVAERVYGLWLFKENIHMWRPIVIVQFISPIKHILFGSLDLSISKSLYQCFARITRLWTERETHPIYPCRPRIWAYLCTILDSTENY